MVAKSQTRKVVGVDTSPIESAGGRTTILAERKGVKRQNCIYNPYDDGEDGRFGKTIKRDEIGK